MSPQPYWSDGQVSLYLGDCRELMLDLPWADCAITDPPYGETSLKWDKWPDGWVSLVTSGSMWCFGSLRMFLAHRDEFALWKLSQDVIWEKHRGSMFAADRFKRVHEQATHWYRGEWSAVHHETPRELGGNGHKHVVTRGETPHTGQIGNTGYTDDGRRLVRSVIGILDPLIRYACPPGGLILDPFAGSGSTLDAARCAGRRAMGIEADERYIEIAARRLSQMALEVS